MSLVGDNRTFIPAYDRIVFPLTRLTERGREFKWTQEYEAAFKDLKAIRGFAAILAYSDLAPSI